MDNAAFVKNANEGIMWCCECVMLACYRTVSSQKKASMAFVSVSKSVNRRHLEQQENKIILTHSYSYSQTYPELLPYIFPTKSS